METRKLCNVSAGVRWRLRVLNMHWEGFRRIYDEIIVFDSQLGFFCDKPNALSMTGVCKQFLVKIWPSLSQV